MIPLKMTPELIISTFLLLLSFSSFIFVYNKAIRNRVEKEDLKDMKLEVDKDISNLKDYVDKQDRGIHARTGELHKTTNDKLDIIINKLIK